MRVFAFRRPEMLLLASLILCAAVLISRSIQPPAPQVAIDTSELAPAPVALSSQEAISSLQARIRQNPDDTAAYAQLGLALLQRVRETADPNLYNQADQAFDAALQRDPNQIDALIGKGTLALARHHFDQALVFGERARAINPYRALVYGVIGDAYNELGRYDEASDAIQKMVDTRPDLSSYSRVSYVRELHGDTEGAIEAMKLAISAGGPATENTLWTQVQLGNLYFNSGQLADAEQTYLSALQTRPDYAYAIAGMAKVRAAKGEYEAAISAYKQIVERLPLPEFVIALAELYEVTGHTKEARQQYDLVRALQQLNAGAGVDVDMELALFEADHGGNRAQTLDQARTVYARRPSIYAADALAWTLYRDSKYDEAWRYSQEALRLGTLDAPLYYRAGMIALARNDTATAQTLLQKALDINPYFSVLHAPQAQQTLAKLKASTIR